MTDNQFSIFDYDHNGGLNIGAQYALDGFTNVYDKKPDHDCDVAVIDHEGHRFKTRFYFNQFRTPVFNASDSKGYDICWWREARNELQ